MSFHSAIQRMKARKKAFSGGGKPYKETAKILSQSIKTNVESGGRPKWRPRKYSYSHPILDKTGTMRDRAESTALRWHKNPDGYSIHVRAPEYGYVHQYRGVRTKYGSRIQKVIRKFAVVQPSERRHMVQVFRDAFIRK